MDGTNARACEEKNVRFGGALILFDGERSSIIHSSDVEGLKIKIVYPLWRKGWEMRLQRLQAYTTVLTVDRQRRPNNASLPTSLYHELNRVDI